MTREESKALQTIASCLVRIARSLETLTEEVMQVEIVNGDDDDGEEVRELEVVKEKVG